VLDLVITSAARKDIRRLPNDILPRIDAAILGLRAEPYPSGCAKLSATDGLYRIRVGEYRVIYAVQMELARIAIARVRHRREVYDHL
jgi:mRNA interferase RelE/StbE